MTDATPAATDDLPFLRDLDGYLYIRHHGGRFVIGAFEPNGKPWAPSGVPTDGFVELGPDWEHFGPVLASARARVPALGDLGFAHFLRGPESFTRTPTSSSASCPGPGLFVAAGRIRRGSSSAGVGRGRGRVDRRGHMTRTLVEVDVARRVDGRASVAGSTSGRSRRSGGLYAMHWAG